MTSGVSQGSVLGPQRFTIYINDLEEGTESTVAEFADETKICRGTVSIEETGGLQKNVDRLGEWAKKGQMEYNVEKCEVIHFGRRNGDRDYFLHEKMRNGDRDYFLHEKMLRKSETQRDLGVIVQNSLKVNVQVQSTVRKANAMLAFMSRGLGMYF